MILFHFSVEPGQRMNIYLYNLSYYRVRDGPTQAPIKNPRACQNNVVIQVKLYSSPLDVIIFRHVISLIRQVLIDDCNQPRKAIVTFD